MRVNTARWFQLNLFSLCGLCGLCGESSAAPPTLTSLSPAGAQLGTTGEVTATGALDGAKVWASGTGVTVENAKGKLKVAVAKDAVPGVYWLRAHNADGASGLRPFVVGTLPEVTEKEPNDDAKKPHTLEGSSCLVNGKLGKNGDVDCFAVNLKKGQTLVASLEAHHTLRSPMDAVLQIVSADGFVLEENNDWRGLDPQIAYEAKKDGVYIARVFAFPAQPDSSIRHFGSDACVYRLTLTTGAFADYPVPLALSRLGPWRVELQGWNLTPESSKLSFIMGQEYGQTLGTDVPNPPRVRNEPHDVFGLRTKGTLRPPFSATGRIEKAGGTDEYLIQAKKGQSLTLQVESRTLGLAANPIIRVLDKDKSQLARAEPSKLNGDTVLSFAPPADGTYTVAISDLYAGGGSRHTFLLRVLSEPDYELSVASDRFTAEVGKPLTIPVKITRFRGFAGSVEIRAEGSGNPPGLKLEVVEPAKPDPNTITLRLTAEQPVSGAIQLVGSVKGGDPKSVRVVRTAVAEFETTTADPWLTATAAKK